MASNEQPELPPTKPITTQALFCALRKAPRLFFGAPYFANRWKDVGLIAGGNSTMPLSVVSILALDLHLNLDLSIDLS